MIISVAIGFVLKGTLLNFEIIAYLHAVLRNNAEKSCVPFIPFAQFLPLVTSCKTAVQYGDQDIDIDIVNIQKIQDTKFLSAQGFLLLNFYRDTYLPPSILGNH